MFYRPEDGHGLRHNPFGAVVTPRPIGWISSRGDDGQDNLAPYSFFNAVAYQPPQVMFASVSDKKDRDGTKDTVANIRDTGVFCVNIVELAMKDRMNATAGAYAREVDEFEHAKIERAECRTIACSHVAGAPAVLECKLTQIVPLIGDTNIAVFGEVVGVHLRDDCMVDGRFEVKTYQPLSRLGYRDYAAITETFSLNRPDEWG